MTTDAPVTGIGNIIIAVADMERSLAFYRDAIGLPVRFANPEFAFLQAGGVTLCLRHAPRAGQAPPGGDTRVEIVFDVREIHAAHDELKARGVVFRVEPRVVTGNLWATDFRDPDGHVLSIFGPSATQTEA
jgi:catechol 2,3-dioxygenase-like lactoylglutathione lyase family enzyme